MKQISIIAGVIVFMVGCASRPLAPDSSGRYFLAVSFPQFKQTRQEYIQSVEVEIHWGRVAAINHLPEDWDVELAWDNPGLLKLTYSARHFSAGLRNVRELDGFITIQPEPSLDFEMTTVLVTDIPTTSGQGDERRYSFTKTNLVFSPIATSVRPRLLNPSAFKTPDWLTTGATLPSARNITTTGEYIIQRGDTLEDVAKHFHLTVESLVSLNPGLSVDTMKVGRKIKVVMPKSE